MKRSAAKWFAGLQWLPAGIRSHPEQPGSWRGLERRAERSGAGQLQETAARASIQLQFPPPRPAGRSRSRSRSAPLVREPPAWHVGCLPGRPGRLFVFLSADKLGRSVRVALVGPRRRHCCCATGDRNGRARRHGRLTGGRADGRTWRAAIALARSHPPGGHLTATQRLCVRSRRPAVIAGRPSEPQRTGARPPMPPARAGPTRHPCIRAHLCAPPGCAMAASRAGRRERRKQLVHWRRSIWPRSFPSIHPSRRIQPSLCGLASHHQSGALLPVSDWPAGRQIMMNGGG